MRRRSFIVQHRTKFEGDVFTLGVIFLFRPIVGDRRNDSPGRLGVVGVVDVDFQLVVGKSRMRCGVASNVPYALATMTKDESERVEIIVS